ncbi:hypothetical protein L2E82_18121 [Cichorium intybus]|uniref:Uncharacterized protein n=1 Tax=Cichorium intybus TaxID=13427 RepID=A0ACB9F8Z4_CICIN|nr:hypothetical protein L2E82_18121 [Cichorium intybus]
MAEVSNFVYEFQIFLTIYVCAMQMARRHCPLQSLCFLEDHRPKKKWEKLQWSTEQQKCLLETCIKEVNKFGRKG